MLGLRTKEDSDFTNYFEIVQAEACKAGCIYFLDTSEGKDNVIAGINVCELSGWLVPKSEAEAFEKVWLEFNEDDTWVDYYVFAIPNYEDEQLKIKFEET